MNYLLDTNVISESTKKNPDSSVSEFLNTVPAKSLYLSVLSIGEIRKGIANLKVKLAKTHSLTLWLENELMKSFSGRIIPVNIAVADKWGFMTGNIKDPLPAIDSLIAATAICNNLILVTRNSSDFSKFQLETFNPWLSATEVAP